ncbi:MAG: DUF819 family protein [Bacteroidales bacterium]|nr:DUF819 family protein [Bacteroidales bacterium]
MLYNNVLQVVASMVYLFGVPLAVILLARKWTFINKISPMMVLYCIGLLVGNVGIVNSVVSATCESVSNITVLVAIPLMLICCDFKVWSAKKLAKAFFTGFASVMIVILAGFFIFRPDEGTMATEAYAKVSAVMTGIYTGGIPNIGAISKAVGMPNDLYLLVTSYDLIITGLYLIFVIFFGKAVFRKLLPLQGKKDVADFETPDLQIDKENRFWKKVLAVCVALIVAAVSYAVSLIVPIDNNVAVIVLLITTLSLALSLSKPVKRLGNTFDLGLYFVYVFCLSIATMVNVHDLKLLENMYILYYIAFTVFGSLLLQILFAKIFRIDGDTVLVSSVALINSPPFVPMVAAILKNRDVVITGIAIGLIGYAIGNYLGVGIYYFLVQ